MTEEDKDEIRKLLKENNPFSDDEIHQIRELNKAFQGGKKVVIKSIVTVITGAILAAIYYAIRHADKLPLILAAAVLLLVSGCTMVDSVTDATKAKTVAAGSDTWGGGGCLAAATAENPVPSIDFWFGRRKAWYISVKDKDTGDAAAKIVKASNSSLEVKAGTDGVGAKQ